MSWRRIRTLIRREVFATFRDPFTITILVLVPLMSLLLFGFILSIDVKHLGLGVFDAAGSPASRRLLSELASRQSFTIHHFDRRADLDQAIVGGDVSVALVIPPDFDRDLGEARGGREPAEIQVVYDGGETVLAGNAEGFIESIVASATAELAPRDGAPPPRRIEVNARALFNPTFDGAPFMVAGVFGWVLTFVAILLTAVTIVNERMNGTFEQLQVTPATRSEEHTSGLQSL